MSQQESRTQGLELRLEPGADPDTEELERLTAALQRELLDLRAVEDVERPPGAAAPEGTRALPAVAVGALVVKLVKSAGGLRAVTQLVQTWLASQPTRTVKLELDGDVLEVSGISKGDQERLITAWIQRHAEG